MVFSGSAQNERKPDKEMKDRKTILLILIREELRMKLKPIHIIFEVHLKSEDRNFSAFIVTSGFSKIKNMTPDK